MVGSSNHLMPSGCVVLRWPPSRASPSSKANLSLQPKESANRGPRNRRFCRLTQRVFSSKADRTLFVTRMGAIAPCCSLAATPTTTSD